MNLLTPAEAAELLCVSTDALGRWARAGRIRKVYRPGEHRRYVESEILKLSRELAQDTVTPKYLARLAGCSLTAIYSEIERGCLIARKPIPGWAKQPWSIDRADGQAWLKLWLESPPHGYDPSHEWH